MKILVTGASGFVGKNLVSELRNRGYDEIFEFGRGTEKSLLQKYTSECDFVYHLAGVNRPKDEREFMEGNFGFTSELLDCLQKNGNKSPVLITSSIQAELDNPYGKSKRAGEELLFEYGRKSGGNVLVYRFPNLFGKWSKPNYNTVVATYCYNVSRDMEISVNDRDAEIVFCYIDDVVDELIRALEGVPNREGAYCKVALEYRVKLGRVADLILSFRDGRDSLKVPDVSDGFVKKLYSTYTSFLPRDGFLYPLHSHSDSRGSFSEFIKMDSGGQVSINVSKPGVTKGNHWHHTKHEKFLVVSGEALLKFRQIHSDEILEYRVTGEKLEVIDIPAGYTHSISNVGSGDLVTVMWASEIFDPQNPDTYEMEV